MKFPVVNDTAFSAVDYYIARLSKKSSFRFLTFPVANGTALEKSKFTKLSSIPLILGLTAECPSTPKEFVKTTPKTYFEGEGWYLTTA